MMMGWPSFLSSKYDITFGHQLHFFLLLYLYLFFFLQRGFVEWDDFQAKVLIIATWMEVGFFGIADGYSLVSNNRL